MTKEAFAEVLKRKGYGSAHIKDGMVTIDLVGVDKAEVKRTFMQVGLLAKKVGYKHSYRVCLLEESNG